MNIKRTMIRPMIASLAVVGFSLGAAACSDDDGNDHDIDNPVDNPVDGVDDQIDDGAENLEEHIDSDTDGEGSDTVED